MARATQRPARHRPHRGKMGPRRPRGRRLHKLRVPACPAPLPAGSRAYHFPASLPVGREARRDLQFAPPSLRRCGALPPGLRPHGCCRPAAPAPCTCRPTERASPPAPASNKHAASRHSAPRMSKREPTSPSVPQHKLHSAALIRPANPLPPPPPLHRKRGGGGRSRPLYGLRGVGTRLAPPIAPRAGGGACEGRA